MTHLSSGEESIDTHFENDEVNLSEVEENN